MEVTAPPEDRVARLACEAAVPPIVARLLLARGIESAREADLFFHPDESHLYDPFLLDGVHESAERLVAAARNGRRIVVFGDYDVDGVTAVAQLKAALARAGATAIAFIPHRLKDGYGFTPETVRRVIGELAPSVIVTVDCGITAVDGGACAREAGVDVIVTDHHVVPDRVPEGAVIVNPHMPGSSYPCADLSGSGVAFKLAQGIARKAGVSLSTESLLRAACLGTIADIVPLAGENRTIAALGLAALSRPRAPGLAALLESCGITGAPTSEEVAFRIAPRLNAAGRLDTAEIALALFEERDPGRAKEIALELCLRNSERQSIERRVVEAARQRIERDFDPERDALIVEGDASWHRGVLGIAASRLAREYNRPVLLFALEGERASGSGRSIPGLSLHATLKEMGDGFFDFGGHDQAVGGSISRKDFAAFQADARAYFAESVPRERFIRRESAEAELALEDVSDELLLHLGRFEPHGAGNPRPVFSCGAARAEAPFRAIGEMGWRGRLARASGGGIEAVAWREAANVGELSASGDFRIRYRVSQSRWSGRPEVEIVGAAPQSSPSPRRGEGRGEGLEAPTPAALAATA